MHFKGTIAYALKGTMAYALKGTNVKIKRGKRAAQLGNELAKQKQKTTTTTTKQQQRQCPLLAPSVCGPQS